METNFKIAAFDELHNGWLAFTKNWGFFVLLTIALAVSNSSTRYKSDDNSSIPGVVLLIIIVVSTVVNAIVEIISTDAYIRSIRGESRIPFSTLFRKVSIPTMFKVIIFDVIYGIAVLIGIIFLIIPGIYIAVQYGFGKFLIVDQGLGIGEAMKKSSKMTEGVKMSIVWYGFISIGVTIAGIFALIIGIFAAMPTISLGYASIYEKLFNRDKIASPEPVIMPAA